MLFRANASQLMGVKIYSPLAITAVEEHNYECLCLEGLLCILRILGQFEICFYCASPSTPSPVPQDKLQRDDQNSETNQHKLMAKWRALFWKAGTNGLRHDIAVFSHTFERVVWYKDSIIKVPPPPPPRVSSPVVTPSPRGLTMRPGPPLCAAVLAVRADGQEAADGPRAMLLRAMLGPAPGPSEGQGLVAGGPAEQDAGGDQPRLQSGEAGFPRIRDCPDR